jgi:hypothetical protein
MHAIPSTGDAKYIASFAGVNDTVENGGKIVNKSGNLPCGEVNG